MRSIAVVDVTALLALAGQTALHMMFPAMPRWRPKEKPPLSEGDHRVARPRQGARTARPIEAQRDPRLRRFALNPPYCLTSGQVESASDP